MTTQLAYLDVETTGLIPGHHQIWEVCVWLEEWDAPRVTQIPHSLANATPEALAINGYWERCDEAATNEQAARNTPFKFQPRRQIAQVLTGRTIVGANPPFDMAHLAHYLGYAPWHYRAIDVEQAPMWLFGEDRPVGFARLCEMLRERGHDIPEPDHTALGDVRALRAAHEALWEMV